MIYVRIEMWPKGDRARARILGEATICNDGTGTKDVGNYYGALSKIGGFRLRQGEFQDPEYTRITEPLTASIWRRFTVDSFRRLKLGSWDLIAAAVADARRRGR